MPDKPKAERDAERMLADYLAHVEGTVAVETAASQLLSAADRVLRPSLGPVMAEDWIREYFGLPPQRERQPAIGSAWQVDGAGAASAEGEDAV